MSTPAVISSEASSPVEGLKLTVVGCSGSFPGPTSSASCYLLQAHDGERNWSIVFDLGSGSLGALQNYVHPRELDAVVLSHLHPDHCIDLCGLFVVRTYHPHAPAERLLPVYGPAGTYERMTAAYRAEPTSDTDLTTSYSFRDIKDESTWSIGPFTITGLLMRHTVEAYGFRIEAAGRTLVYTGDTDYCPALVRLEENADVVLSECAFVDGRDDHHVGVHLTGSRAGRAASRAQGVGLLVLTHIPAWNDVQECLEQTRSTWSGRLETAYPGLVIDI